VFKTITCPFFTAREVEDWLGDKSLICSSSGSAPRLATYSKEKRQTSSNIIIWLAGVKKMLSQLKNELSLIFCLSGIAGRQAGACPTWLQHFVITRVLWHIERYRNGRAYWALFLTEYVSKMLILGRCINQTILARNQLIDNIGFQSPTAKIVVVVKRFAKVRSQFPKTWWSLDRLFRDHFSQLL
tara:strand:- start:62 stop:616 length:555 start_codon:yes stop_codon:yes gene_type:complete